MPEFGDNIRRVVYHQYSLMILQIRSLAFITASVCIPHWAIRIPIGMNRKWLSDDLF